MSGHGNETQTEAFEVKAEREGPSEGPGELSIEFELEWGENEDKGNGGSGQLKSSDKFADPLSRRFETGCPKTIPCE